MSNERAKFEEWCPIKITNEAKAPKAVALKRAYWTSWQARAELAESERQASRVAALEERWVSVDERLPEGNDNYLVATPDRGVEEARYVADDQDWYAVATDAYNENIELHNVTHWALLPDPPAAAIRSLAEATVREKS